MKEQIDTTEQNLDRGLRQTSQTADFSSIAELDLQYIVGQIKQSLDVESIHFFGKRFLEFEADSLFSEKISEKMQIHWYLLVVTEKIHQGACNLQAKLNKDPKLKSQITLLHHTRDSIVKALKNHNQFFAIIIQKSKYLYERPGLKKITINEGSNEAHYNIKIYDLWKSRLNNAEAFYEATENILLDHREVCTSLIAQSVEQICLGLIYVFMGYKPDTYSLSFLINLCASFEPRFQQFFPRVFEEDEMYFNALTKASSAIKYEGSTSFFHDDMEPEYLKRRCLLFIDLAKEVCKNKFELSNIN